MHDARKRRTPPRPGSRVHVLGLGRSGVSAALLAARLGCRVTATDLKPREALAGVERLEEAGVVLDLGGHDPALFTTAQLVVVSPGVPASDHLVAAADAGAEVIAEVELAYRCSRAMIVGITGSNGKSTVTSMIGAIMARSGRPAWTGGNLGTPLSEAAGGPADVEGGVLVVELSSFQLERISMLTCGVAVLLNITPDHLDRYPGFEEYARAKGNIFSGQGAGHHAVVPGWEPEAVAQARRSRGTLHLVGDAGGEVIAHGGVLELRDLGGTSARFETSRLGLTDDLSLKNGMVAVAAAILAGADPAAVEQGLGDFKPLPHRCELVDTIRGVRWVNDSKATNPASVVAALASMPGPVILVAGGLDKKLDYSSILPAARERVRRVFLVGQASAALEDALGADLEVERAGDLETAVRRADAIASPGDTVLLSPACASFDQFRNFEHRGEEFRRLVLDLPGSRGGPG